VNSSKNVLVQRDIPMVNKTSLVDSSMNKTNALKSLHNNKKIALESPLNSNRKNAINAPAEIHPKGLL